MNDLDKYRQMIGILQISIPEGQKWWVLPKVPIKLTNNKNEEKKNGR